MRPFYLRKTSMRRSTLTEGRKRFWDANISLITTLVAVIGAVTSVLQFNKGERDKIELEYASLREKDRLDFNRKVWLERLETYRSTAEAAGKIAAEPNTGKQFDADLQAFDAAYWGRMILVEDPIVAAAMQKFRDAVQEYRDRYANADQVRRAAAELGEALHNSIISDEVNNGLNDGKTRLK